MLPRQWEKPGRPGGKGEGEKERRREGFWDLVTVVMFFKSNDLKPLYDYNLFVASCVDRLVNRKNRF